MIIEFLDDAVPPRLRRRNEPEIDAITQAETNKRPHASWVGRTSEKSPFVVHLEVLRDSHAQPDRINSVQYALRCTGRHRLNPTPVDGDIDGMQAVELDRAGKITGADQVNLMGLVGRDRRKLGIFLALRDISSGPPMG